MLNNIKKIFIFTLLFVGHIFCLKQPTLNILCVVNNTFDYANASFIEQIVGLGDYGHTLSVYIPDCSVGEWDLTENYKSVFDRRIYYSDIPANIMSYDIILCENGVLGKKMIRIKEEQDIKAKLITFFLGPDITHNGEIKYGSYDQLFTGGDLFLPTCEYVKNKLYSKGLDLNKTHIICPGIDCNKFKFRLQLPDIDKEIRLITVGNFDYVSNIESAIKAFKSIVAVYPKSILTVVGNGKLQQRIIHIIERLGLKNKVKLVGALNQRELINELYQSHIFLYSSSTQKNGVQQGVADTVKQAMAIGLPVVAAHHGGILDLVQDSVTGFLVSENDHDKLAHKTRNLIRYPTKWPKIVLEARYKIAKYMNVQNTCSKLEKILLNLVGKN